MKNMIYDKNKKGTRKNEYSYLLLYSIFFILTFGLSFYLFFLEGKSFIWEIDGWSQHFKAINYYSDWLKDIVKNVVVKHKLIVPLWSASIGYGSDIITTLHYYVIGDPLNLLSVFVPNRYMVHFYDGMVFLRLYLSGLSFSYYCFLMNGYQKNGFAIEKKYEKYAITAGSIIYVFCGYTYVFGLHHPFFINPLIYLPLLLAGTEKVLRREKPWLLICMVCVSAMSNFYFFYMLVLFVVLYAIVRCIDLFKGHFLKESFYAMVRMLAYAINGLLLSAVIFLPVILLFFSGSRQSNRRIYSIFYKKNFYRTFSSMFISLIKGSNHTYLAYSGIVLFAIVLLFVLEKRTKSLKILCILLTAFLCFPIFGRIFNGFSYASNRWEFVFGMLMAVIVVTQWDKFINLSKKNLLLLIGAYGIYGIILYATNQAYIKKEILAAYVFMGIILLVAAVGRNCKKEYTKRLQQYGILAVIVASVCVNANLYFGNKGGNRIRKYYTITEANKHFISNTDKAVKEVTKSDKSVFRYSGDYKAIIRNSTLESGLLGTSYYWSLSSGIINQFFREMEMKNNNDYKYRDLDGRTALAELAGVKYYVTTGTDQIVPYGYVKKGNYKHDRRVFHIYENKYALPLGYTYTNYITRKEYEKLSSLEKQNILLQSVLLEEQEKGYEKKTVTDNADDEIPYEITCNDGVTKKEKSFIVSKEKGQIALNLAGKKAVETYVRLGGVNFESKAKKRMKRRMKKEKTIIKIIARYSNGKRIKKDIEYYTPSYKNYNNRHYFCVNLGYNEAAIQSITLGFKEEGVYTIRDISVNELSMDRYEEVTNKLKENVLENITLKTNQITGNITLDTSKLLCLAVPYSKGWTAYIDGKEAAILQANTMFMALNLEKGTHKIVLKYCTPGLNMGMFLSLFGVLMLIGVVVYQNKKQRS